MKIRLIVPALVVACSALLVSCSGGPGESSNAQDAVSMKLTAKQISTDVESKQEAEVLFDEAKAYVAESFKETASPDKVRILTEKYENAGDVLKKSHTAKEGFEWSYSKHEGKLGYVIKVWNASGGKYTSEKSPVVFDSLDGKIKN